MENNLNLFLNRKGENISEMEKIIEEQPQIVPKVREIQIMAVAGICIIFYIKKCLKSSEACKILKEVSSQGP